MRNLTIIFIFLSTTLLAPDIGDLRWKEYIMGKWKAQGYFEYTVQDIPHVLEFIKKFEVDINNPHEIRELIWFTALIHGTDPELSVNMASIESDWLHITNGAIVTSKRGAKGVMQIMKAHEANYHLSRTNLHENILMGMNITIWLLNYFHHNEIAVVAAYNCGPRRVRKWLKSTKHRLPRETRNHIRRYGERKKINGQTKIPILL